jgi:hypothetical protein
VVRKAGQTLQSKEPIERPGQLPGKNTLREEVKQALLNVLRSSDASAASKASAGRTLLEYFADDKAATNNKRGVELTASELDAAIADIGD